MSITPDKQQTWRNRVAIFSILLFFFTLPHTLEDFATGAPAEAGIPAGILSFVISVIFAVQGMGLYGLGLGRRWSYYIHLGIGLFWPIASGFAQLPAILDDAPYRSGVISISYVVGMIVIGILLCFSSFMALPRVTKR